MNNSSGFPPSGYGSAPSQQIISSSAIAQQLTELLKITASKDVSFDLAPVLTFLSHLIEDSNPVISKQSILCCSRLVSKILYTVTFFPSEATKQLWQQFLQVKSKILSTAKFSHNDGVIIHSLKFLEVLVLNYTLSETRREEILFSIDMVPNQHPLLVRTTLEKEGEELLRTLVSWLDQIANWSSTSIIVVLSCLTSLVKQRPQFAPFTVPALLKLPRQLQTLSAQSQLPSIRHAIRTSLSSMAKIRHPAVLPYLESCLAGLTSLGVRTDNLKHAHAETASTGPTASEPELFSRRHEKKEAQSTIDLTTASRFVEILINAQFTLDMFADLIMDNMANLPPPPANAPPSNLDPFQYLLSSLITHLQSTPTSTAPSFPVHPTSTVPPPVPVQPRSDPRTRDPRLGNVTAPPVEIKPKIEEETKVEIKPPTVPSAPPMVYAPKIVPLTHDELKQLHTTSFMRILASEKGLVIGGKASLRSSVLSYLASQVSLEDPLLQRLYAHIFEDFALRKELGLQWLITEHMHEMNSMEIEASRYEVILMHFLRGLKQTVVIAKDHKSFAFLFISAPRLTSAVFDLLKSYCEDTNTVTLGLSTLRDVILFRSDFIDESINTLLNYTTHQNEAIRSPAVRLVTNKLFGHSEQLSTRIEIFASELLASVANYQLSDQTTLEKQQEDEIQSKLFLYFALCTKKASLLFKVVEVYTQCSIPVRKIIHTQSIGLIRTIGMNSSDFLQLLGAIPHKGEPLVLHFLHILTEKGRASNQLISTIKTLYQKKVLDSRFLIPILPGLEKSEVLEFLPKICSLPSAPLKSAITNILKNPSISPSELLIGLHMVDTKDPEQLKKCVEATQICFDQRDVFKPDVLAVVLQQLVDINPLPQLLLRTIMQTVTRYSKLTNFIMSILSRLINKNIWADARLREGFIKCCKLTQPNSYQVLFQIPPNLLEEILIQNADLKQSLVTYLKGNPKVKPPPSIQKYLEPKQ